MPIKRITTIVLLSLLLLITGCSPVQPVEKSDTITVSASIMPQKYFIERIGGDLVTINIMVQPGESPHTYEPAPAQMKDLSQSQLYFAIGVEFEGVWLEKMADVSPEMQIVHTEDGIQRIPLLAHDHGHDDDHDGEHESEEELADHEGEDSHSDHDEDHVSEHDTEDSHTDHNEDPDSEENHSEQDEEHEAAEEGNLDPHTWLSPELAGQQAEYIFKALSELDPENTPQYKQSLDALLLEIEILSAGISETLSGIEQDAFIVFHPSWGYFAQEFGLRQVPIEIDGSEPSPKELSELITFAQEENIKVIFAAPTFNTKTAEVIAQEIDGEVILIDPLAENWLENMNQVADKFASALSQ